MNPFFPASWRPRLEFLFPKDPSRFAGPTLCWWFAAFFLSITTVRSLIHLLAPDGGAGSIATVDTTVEGGNNIIAMFGQWGAIQLLLALLLWVLLVRYRGLVPLILLVFLIEPVLRDLSGRLKPLVTMGIAPGSALNWAVVPIIAIMLWVSLCPARDEL
jgi:hypothetical protein